MEKKQEEQGGQMKELQECVEHLQREKDHLQAQVEKRRNLDERDAQDSGPAKHLVVFGDEDIQANDELSLSSSPNPSPAKSNKDRLH